VKRKSGMIYEAEELHRCLSKGVLESPLLTWNESLNIMRTMDDIRAQIGVVYPFGNNTHYFERCELMIIVGWSV
jgi:hypothetical protein